MEGEVEVFSDEDFIPEIEEELPPEPPPSPDQPPPLPDPQHQVIIVADAGESSATGNPGPIDVAEDIAQQELVMTVGYDFNRAEQVSQNIYLVIK